MDSIDDYIDSDPRFQRFGAKSMVPGELYTAPPDGAIDMAKTISDFLITDQYTWHYFQPGEVVLFLRWEKALMECNNYYDFIVMLTQDGKEVCLLEYEAWRLRQVDTPNP